MTDPFDYEPRLEARLAAHAARATRPIDPAAIAAVAAAGAPRRTWSLPILGPSTGRGFGPMAATLLLVGLLVALIGAMLLSGGRPPFPAFVGPAPSATQRPSATPETSADVPSAGPSVPAPSATPGETPGAPLPAASRQLLVVSDPRAASATWQAPCDNVDRVDPATGASRRIVKCADRVSISMDGSRVAVGGPQGVAILDPRDGHQVGTIDTGKPTYPIDWSPTGRWLEMNVCRYRDSRSSYGPCEVTIASTDGTQVVVPGGGPESGYSPSSWTPDESHLLAPDGRIGDPDGSNLAPLAGDSAQAVWMSGGYGYDSPADMSPDGKEVAYAWRPSVGTRATARDLWVMSIDGTDKHALTSFEPGAELRAVAWSPDGSRMAYVKGLPGQETACCPTNFGRMGPNELWLIEPDGSQHRITVPSELYAPSWSGTLPIHWSPDGSRLAIEAASGSFKNGGLPSSIDTIIVPVDGSAPAVLEDARRPQWSRDGRSIAVVHTTGSDDRREGDPIPPAQIDVVAFDGSDRHEVADPTGTEEGFWFTWAGP
jgi:WD40-like Beta Propeller Repeat